MRVISLASGSKGNAYLVGSGGEWLLIDDGLTFKTLACRWMPFAPALSGVLVTHSHVDHIGGLAALMKKMDVPIYANAATAECIASTAKIPDEAFVCFENGQSFEVGGFSVHPFSIPHDTADPVGYLVKADGETYFHGTDIGMPLDSIGLKLAEADIATLESNHDPVMLRTSGRAPSLIQRIAGPRGHLANDQACALVQRFASPKLKRLGLAHLSHDCNAPHVAEQAMRQMLAEMHRADVSLKILMQDEVVEL